VDRVVRIPFAHNTTFQALGDDKTFGADALIHVVNVGGLVGKRLQLRVADASSKHLVGLYRVPALGKPAFDARIRGIIDPAPGTRYQLEATIDDGTPESGGLLTFRDLGVSGTSTGLELTFDPAAATKASDVLPPQEPN
jgi:hypothetical protein